MAAAPEHLLQSTETFLDAAEAAAHIRFAASSFTKWLRYHLLRPGDPTTGKWLTHHLDNDLDLLRREGHLPCILAHKKHQHFTMPNVHPPRKANQGGYNGFKRYYYFRPTGDRITGTPGSPEFMSQLIVCEQRLAAEQKPNEIPSASAPQFKTWSPTSATEQQPLPSDAILHMGGVALFDQQLPLYPSELQIGQAVLGTERAHEWPALAARLEAEGLPLIDPTVNARFWPMVQKFFEVRHGLDGGLSVNKHVPAPHQRTRIAVSKLQVGTQTEHTNHVDQDAVLLTPEELCERWRWQITPETLANHRSQGIGVAYIKVGRQPLYPLPDVEQFEQQRRFPKPKP